MLTKDKTDYRNHYEWLEDHLPGFMERAGCSWENNCGIISAHGDKCYGYRDTFKDHDVPFYHGVAIYMLTYCRPYSKEVRETDHGWVAPDHWIIDNYERFRPLLPPLNRPNASLLTEPVLTEHDTVYAGYLYVCDGKIRQSPIKGTVTDLKKEIYVKEVQRADLEGRGIIQFK